MARKQPIKERYGYQIPTKNRHDCSYESREAVKLETIRFMKSLIQNAEIDAGELDDDAIVKLLMKDVKKRKDSIAQFTEAGRDEMAADEQEKVDIIQAYLPEMMSKEDIEKIVDEVVSAGATDFGAVMGQVMGKTQGKADGKVVAAVVKEKIS